MRSFGPACVAISRALEEQCRKRSSVGAGAEVCAGEEVHLEATMARPASEDERFPVTLMVTEESLSMLMTTFEFLDPPRKCGGAGGGDGDGDGAGDGAGDGDGDGDSDEDGAGDGTDMLGKSLMHMRG